jgi:galactokinase
MLSVTQTAVKPGRDMLWWMDENGAEHGTRSFRRTRAFSPGRVNLIGDHTDYNEGLALPMAVHLGTTVSFEPDDGSKIVLVSSDDPDPAEVDRLNHVDLEAAIEISPRWARYVAALVALLRPDSGGHGTVSTTLPIGAGLASSAALEVATALALGARQDPISLARTCQRAEHAATGVASGLMDQLVATTAEEGAALLVDFSDTTSSPVPIPEGIDVVVVHSGLSRTLDRSAYSARLAECDAAAYRLKPLGLLRPEDLVAISDPVLRRRARHVVTECDRVRWTAQALRSGELVEAGRLMTASHASLASDFEVSVPALDELVERLVETDGVYGARMTGAGFGGCVVALAETGAVDPRSLKTPAWVVKPSGSAHLVEDRGSELF